MLEVPDAELAMLDHVHGDPPAGDGNGVSS